MKIKSFFVTLCLLGFVNSFVQAEEILRLRVWEGYAPVELRDKFTRFIKQKYGVDLLLDVSYVNKNDDFFEILRDSKADIISPSHNIPKDRRYQLIDLHLVIPVNTDNVPNYQNVVPLLKNLDYVKKDGKLYGTPICMGPYALVYNSSLITTPPNSWKILWDPQFKDKYTIGDHYEVNIYVTALAMGMTKNDIFDYQKLNTVEFQEKLAQLTINANHVWKGVDKPSDIKGLPISATWAFSIPELKAQGEIWKIAEPIEGSSCWFDNLMLSHTLENKPDLKKIAEEWLNFVLSDDFQLHCVRGIGSAPVTSSVKNLLTDDEIALHHLNDPSFLEKNWIPWRILEKADRKGFERLWEKAMTARKTAKKE